MTSPSNNGDYHRLAADAERPPKKIVDHRAAWELLPPVEAVNGTIQERVMAFTKSKGISVEALTALGTRLKVDKGGGVELAWASEARSGAVTAVKFRPLGGKDRYALRPSTWLEPIVIGNVRSLDWFIAEGETDAARLYDLIGDKAAILVLPVGAEAFKHEWAKAIPRGATVGLCHDADDAGDKGARKADRIIGGRTFRIRPPTEGGDWCSWTGDREAFLKIVYASKAQGNGPGLQLVPLTDVEMRSIKWLEKPLWQASAFTLFAGQKGAGKGTYLCSLAARLTQAGENVLFISSEDSASIDLKPRLAAAGAVMERCFIIKGHVRLPGDIDRLEELANEAGGVGLLVIDPVGNHIGATKTGDDGEVRDAIAPLNGLADKLECSLVGVRHPGKDRTRGAVASVLGSTAWVDTPRAVVMAVVDDEDPQVRHIQVVAGNRSLNGAGQAFRIEPFDVPGLDEPVTRAVELGESTKDVEDLISGKGQDEMSKSDTARELILDILEQDGEQESDTLDARVAQETGLAPRSVQNVRSDLRGEGLIKSFPEKDEFGEFQRWKVTRTQAPRGGFPPFQATTSSPKFP